jgi:hypothetical protein
MATVVLLGTLDTKGVEYEYLRDRVQAAGCEVILVDAGIKGTPLTRPDVTREEVAKAVGADVAQLAAGGRSRRCGRNDGARRYRYRIGLIQPGAAARYTWPGWIWRFCASDPGDARLTHRRAQTDGIYSGLR